MIKHVSTNALENGGNFRWFVGFGAIQLILTDSSYLCVLVRLKSGYAVTLTSLRSRPSNSTSGDTRRGIILSSNLKNKNITVKTKTKFTQTPMTSATNWEVPP